MLFTKLLYKLFRQTSKGAQYKLVYQPGLTEEFIEVHLSRRIDADDLRPFWRQFSETEEADRYTLLLSFLRGLDLGE